MTFLQQFEKRLDLNRIAFDTVRSEAAPGMTEAALRRKIEAAWIQAEPHRFTLCGDIVSGERSGAIEGEASDRILRQGDTLIVDLQPGFDGCYADTTRTFFLGTPNEEVCRAYAAVFAALQRMAGCLRPGIPAGEVYSEMQAALVGFGYSCPHHAGHAVGAQKLLEPRLVADCDTPLEEGMLIALEPGVYPEGRFGIRVENNYLITKDGCKELFHYPLAIEHFILGENKE